MRKLRRIGITAGVLLLVAGMAGCEDFIAPPEEDPNAIPEGTVDQLFTSAQVKGYLFNGGEFSRFASVWMQQNDGVARQWSTIATYVVGEGDFNFMDDMYTGGGLIDLRKAQQAAEEQGRRTYAGILKVHEAWMMGLGASVWGDLPYSGAADPEVDNPPVDDQADIYASLQSLLDEAIADLESGEAGAAGGPGSVDLQFGGATQNWIDAAHTLKARLHMHWAEVEGMARYQAARDEAMEGIQSASGNWHQVHSSARTEANPWFLFQENRAGDVAAGAALVDLMNGGTPEDFDDDDPRLAIYFAPDAPEEAPPAFRGSPPGSPEGDPGGDAADINLPAASTYPQPILSCAENQFILAEAEFQLGNEPAARQAAVEALNCQEDWFANEVGQPVDLDEQKDPFEAGGVIDPPLSGQDLLEEIMAQKFIALYLVPEVYNDWKRTCLPERDPAPGAANVPGRFLYSDNERETNENIPPPSQQPPRNANDPNPC